MPRMTWPRAAVLCALLSRGSALHRGELAKASGISDTTIYKALTALTDAGWVDSRPETRDERVRVGRRLAGRPRTYYWLTEVGEVQAREALKKLLAQQARALEALEVAS